MPPKKSNLNARSREARRKRVERAHESVEQTAARNAAQRLRAAERRAQESQEQHEERLRQTNMRTKTARKNNITAAREREGQRQRTTRSLTRASFIRLAPDIDCSAHSKITIGGMDKESTSLEESKSDIKKEETDPELTIPSTRDIVSNVFHYLKEEYKYMQICNNGSPVLAPLAAIHRRTAKATGFTKNTVRKIVEEDYERIAELRRRRNSQGDESADSS